MLSDASLNGAWLGMIPCHEPTVLHGCTMAKVHYTGGRGGALDSIDSRMVSKLIILNVRLHNDRFAFQLHFD